MSPNSLTDIPLPILTTNIAEGEQLPPQVGTPPPLPFNRWRQVAMSIAMISVGWFAIDSSLSHVTERPEPLRVAINPWPGYGYALYARHLDAYRQRGVDVRLIEFDSLSASSRAFERNQVDAFFGTIGDVLQTAAHSDRKPRIILVADYSLGADVVLGNSKKIQSLRDLSGRAIGLEANSLGPYMLSRALESVGLSLADVEMHPMHYSELSDAYHSGHVEAVVAYPPVSQELLREDARLLFSTEQIPGDVVDVLAVASDVLENRPEDVKLLLDAFFAAEDHAAAHPDEAASTIAHQLRMSVDDYSETITCGVHVVGRAEQAQFFGPQGKLPSVVKNVAEVLRETGDLEKVPDPHSLIWTGEEP